MKPTKILFVCLGNICRSPTADGVLRKKIAENNLSHMFEVDSAGTSNWHVGGKPDQRSSAAAMQRGYDLYSLRARQVCENDFEEFDYILAMDNDNIRELKMIAPASFKGTLGLLLDYYTGGDIMEVPDPYHGGAKGFEHVLDLVENACDGLLTHLKTSSPSRMP